MKYIHVKKLEEYHPGYKDRSLIWCKAYFKMMNTDPEFEMLCETDKWRFMAFIMLELQLQKPVPIDEDWLRRKGFDIKKRAISLTLKMLHNSVELVTEEPEVRSETVTQSRVDKSIVEKSRIEDIPPPLTAVSDYFLEQGYRRPEADKFHDYYTANGWKVGRNPMKDWRATARNWCRKLPAEAKVNFIVAEAIPERPPVNKEGQKKIRKLIEGITNPKEDKR